MNINFFKSQIKGIIDFSITKNLKNSLIQIIKDTKESSGTFTDAVWPFIQSESINFGFSQTFNALLKNDCFNSSIQLFLNILLVLSDIL